MDFDFSNPFGVYGILHGQQQIGIVLIVFRTEAPFSSIKPFASRALSALELLFGAFVVIGHNVFHIVPNEVILLCLLGLASIRLRDSGWSGMGSNDQHRGGASF